MESEGSWVLSLNNPMHSMLVDMYNHGLISVDISFYPESFTICSNKSDEDILDKGNWVSLSLFALVMQKFVCEVL